MGSFNGNIGIPSEGFNLKVEYSISQNITENYSEITATGYIKRNNSTYYPYNTTSLGILTIDDEEETYTGSYNLGSDGYKEIVSNTVRVYHEDDGTKSINISFSFDGKLSNWYPNGTISEEIKLPTIPRANEITCTSPYIGEVAIISVDKKSSSFTSTLTYKIGTLTGTIITKTSKDNVNFATSSIADKIYAQIPNAKEIKGTIYCDTYSDNTKIGDTKSTTFSLYTKESVCKPDVSATIVDTNTNVTNVMGSNTKFVKYVSKPKVTISATAKNSASIKSYYINLNDGQTASKQTNTFSTMGSNKVSVSVTDTRTYTNSKDYTLDMVNYIKLHINEISISRPEGTSNEAILNVNGAYYNGIFTDTKSNSLSVSFKYRLSGTTDEWTDGGELTPTITNNTFKISNLTLGENFDYEQEYQFVFVFEDTFMVVNENYILEKGQEVFAIGENEVYVNGTFYLNNISIMELLKNYLEYQDGEKMVSKGDISVAGFLTGSKKSIVFSVPVEKSMVNIKNITINALKVNIRHSDGGYIYNQVDLVGETDITLKATIATNNIINFVISAENAYDFTNNAPVSVFIYGKYFDITFNT